MWQWTVDVDFVKTIWPEAVDIDPDVLSTLLYTASSLCAAYAPTHTDPGVTEQVPETWKLALIFQARHTWGQMSGGQKQEYGPDGLAIPVYPLVFAARDLLRPKSSPLRRLR
ncbi:hypothetical protein B1A87_005250 [Arthrobacter sp. KBS0703]|uniref:hypothetical protein n=1 Tax=Arthrobacter sp. KBS0703 TaxID=1955698 RepID=UPI00098FA1D7|nr:hypothetical protein [Arthrobacter sp. KBS0703]TSE15403.1 hypothetical protein B1A87_005250 [Arthrobacter sp. KBS0703]